MTTRDIDLHAEIAAKLAERATLRIGEIMGCLWDDRPKDALSRAAEARDLLLAAAESVDACVTRLEMVKGKR